MELTSFSNLIRIPLLGTTVDAPCSQISHPQNEGNKVFKRKLLEPLPCVSTSEDTRQLLRVSPIPNCEILVPIILK